MRRWFWLGLAAAQPAWAGPPALISHQGRVLDAAGQPLAGQHTLTIRLFDTATSGSVLWEQSYPLDFDGGWFSVVLGGVPQNPLAVDVFDRDGVWVSVEVDQGGPIGARARLTSVPYALIAGAAERATVADSATSVSGGVVDATEIRVDGVTVIDGDGAFVGAGALPDGCDAGQVALADGVGGWTCGTADPLSGLDCADGQLPAWDAGAWACTTAVDTLAGLGCAADDVPRFDGAAWTCAAAVDADTLGALVCQPSQIPKFDGATWRCGADDDENSDVLATLDCADDDIVRWDGSAWVCDVDRDEAGTDTLSELACGTHDVARWNGAVWACAADVTGITGGAGLAGGGTAGAVTLAVQFGGSGSVDRAARADHDHAGVYAPLASAVPIGGVVDWWRPTTATPVPTGWAIADGAEVTDARSPFLGQKLPDLRGMFTRGANGDERTTGGAATHSHGVTMPAHAHTYSVDHDHAAISTDPHLHQWAAYTNGDWGSYDAAGGAVTVTDWDNGMNNTGTGTYPMARFGTGGVQYYTTSARVGVDLPDLDLPDRTTGTALQVAGTTGTASTLPPYIAMVKLVRIF